MLSSPSSQKAHSPVTRHKKNGGGGEGASSPTSGRVVYRLVAGAMSPRQLNDVSGSVHATKSDSDFNRKNKNTCGKESRMIQREAPLKPSRRWGGGPRGGETRGFCLETTLSNLLQDADISKNTAVGVSWGRGCHSPRREIKTAWAEPAGCGGEGREQPAPSPLQRLRPRFFFLPGAAGSGPLNGGGPETC